VVFEYNLLSIYNIRRCLDIFERMGYDHEKVLLLVNRYDDGSGLAFQEFKKTVKYPLFWKIPNQDYTSVIRSMNKGIPLSQLNPKSKLSQSFLKLAGQLNGGISPEHGADKNPARLSFVKKLFSKR
jgi:Flp pilus assembly CpaE family ATPase